MSNVTDNIMKPAKPRKSILLWLALFTLTAGVLYAGRFFYMTQQQYILKLNTLAQHQRFLTTQTAQTLDSLKLELSKMRTPDAGNTDFQWSLNKAQYAIQLAQLNAKWGHDTSTTIALLQQADQFLSQHNNAQLFSIRQALAHEIAEAQATPHLDEPGLLSQLDALQQITANYSFEKSIVLAPPTTSPPTPASLSQNDWRERLKATLLSFKQFFVIRHHDSPLEPLMSPAFQTAQKEIIRLNLQEAAWAVLERDDTIYQLALTQARDNILRAFGKENEKAVSILKQIEQLQTIRLQTKAFIPSESFPLLEAVIHGTTSSQSGAAS